MIITSRYTSRCERCNGIIQEHSKCNWVPGSKRVFHLEGQCGGRYAVKVVYDATSKMLTVYAPDWEAAVADAARQCDSAVAVAYALAVAEDAHRAATTLEDRRAAAERVDMLRVKLADARRPDHVRARPTGYVCYQGDVIVGVKTTDPRVQRVWDRTMQKIGG